MYVIKISAISIARKDEKHRQQNRDTYYGPLFIQLLLFYKNCVPNTCICCICLRGYLIIAYPIVFLLIGRILQIRMRCTQINVQCESKTENDLPPRDTNNLFSHLSN